MKYFKLWGCLAKAEDPLPKRVKSGPKMLEYVFIGSVVNSKASQFLFHKSDNLDIHVNTILESDNVDFFEKIDSYKTECVSTSQ